MIINSFKNLYINVFEIVGFKSALIIEKFYLQIQTKVAKMTIKRNEF